MRTEQEMFNIIINNAKEDQRIRAAYMNGSRANPNIKKDKYQDYDIVYVVTETSSFLQDSNWITRFGELAMVQQPDSNDFGWGQTSDFGSSYAWLMLFKDGNRVDLQIKIKDAMLEEYLDDTLTVPLIDKDNILPQIPASNDRGYWISKPTNAQYSGCCNEFWWCLNNVAKGIVRDQISYTMRMYYEVVHVQLDKMLEWYVGIETDFSVSVGMWGKYINEYLPVRLYEKYKRTYSTYEDLWTAIFVACELFRTVAINVGQHLGFDYNRSDDDNMMEYMTKVKNNGL